MRRRRPDDDDDEDEEKKKRRETSKRGGNLANFEECEGSPHFGEGEGLVWDNFDALQRDDESAQHVFVVAVNPVTSFHTAKLPVKKNKREG